MPILAVFILLISNISSGVTLQNYQHAPLEMNPLLDAAPFPVILASPNRQYIAVAHRSNLEPIQQLMVPEKGLAGLRFNPINRTQSRITNKFNRF